ncbi:MAG: 6-phosphogluconolactonase [Planctomycetes bacterium]|nr:6-phosphogluconolactonase [Planctomycetota bacterium]
MANIEKIHTKEQVEIIYNHDKKFLAEQAGRDFIALINSKDEAMTIALCGGRSVTDFYEALEDHFSEIRDPKRLHIFLIDERFQPADTNMEVLKNGFFDKAIAKGYLTADNFHGLPDNASLEETTEIYNQELKKISSDMNFDIVVLGSGEDGHIAGIFPGKDAIKETKKGYVCLKDSPKPPAERITATPSTIADSKNVILFFLGEGKKDAYNNFINNIPKEKNPSSLVRQSGNVKVFTNIK